MNLPTVTFLSSQPAALAATNDVSAVQPGFEVILARHHATHVRRDHSAHRDSKVEHDTALAIVVHDFMQAAAALAGGQPTLTTKNEEASEAFHILKEAVMNEGDAVPARRDIPSGLLSSAMALPQTDATGAAGHSPLAHLIATSSPALEAEAFKPRLPWPVVRREALHDGASTAGALRAVAVMQTRLETALPEPAAASLSDFMNALDDIVARSAQTPPGSSAGTRVNQAESAVISDGILHAHGTLLPGNSAALTSAMSGPSSLFSPSGLPSLSGVVGASLRSPVWAAEFCRQLTALAQGNHGTLHRIDLQLSPPQLGPLRITLQVHDNVAQALIVSAHASVRQTVENALPQLQQHLAQVGLSLGQASVSDFEQTGTSFGNKNRQNGKTAVHKPGATDTADSAIASSIIRSPPPQSPDALVDTYA